MRLSCRHAVTLALSAATSLAGAAPGQDAVRLLQQQGQYWQDRGDYKRAAESWEKLGLADPGNVAALYGLGLAALKRGDQAGADPYLQRLRALGGQGARLAALLEQDIRLSEPGVDDVLEQARALVVARDLDGAMAKYREALRGQAPQGELAFEYYNYLGYASEGLRPAIEGLQRLLRTEPGNAKYELGLAKHLMRDLPRRPEAMRRLQKLATVPAVASEAQEAWREMLTWIGPPKAEFRASFEAYLAIRDDDAEIRSLLDTARAQQDARTARHQPASASPAADATARAWVQDPRITAGMQALQAGDLAAAETAFAAVLRQTPRQADALGGMGLLRMQQRNFTAAEKLLVQAVRSAEAWQPALDGARYWKLLEAASQAQEKGDLASARQLVDRALALQPSELAARHRLGQVQAAAGQWDAALETYGEVLEQAPGNAEALDGMIAVLAQRGEPEAALRLVEGLPAEQRDRLEGVAALRAQVASGRARAALQLGEYAMAEAAWHEARQHDPGDVWLGYELARLLLRRGEAQQAQEVVDQMLRDQADDPDAWYAGALVAELRQDWRQAHELVSRVPPAQRSADMRDLAQRTHWRQALLDARRAAAQGDAAQAARILAALESDAGLGYAQMTDLAASWVETGHAEHGIVLMRRLVPVLGVSEPGYGLLLRYAAALAQTGQNVEAGIILRQLDDAGVNASERAALDRIAALKTDPAARAGLADLLAAAAASRQADPGAAIDPALAGRGQPWIADPPEHVASVPVQGIELRAGQLVRANNGEAGLSRVRETSAPIEVRLPAAQGTVAVRLTPVELDAGHVGRGYAHHSRFGAGPVAAADSVSAGIDPVDEAQAYLAALDGAGVTRRQRDSGVGVSVAYESPDGVQLDLGSTPVGFQRSNVVGGVSLSRPWPAWPDARYQVDLSRRAVTDSLLSYAGAVDSRTGQEWGGVTANGARLELSRDDGRIGAYGYGAWHALLGHNVASNRRLDSGAGVYWHLRRSDSEQLTAGLHLGAMFYDRNLRFFTLGHGGYFSPQSMYMLSLPLNWAQRSGALSYRLQAALGVQHFREDGADYFPNNGAMQARAESAAAQARAAGLAGATARYDGQSSTALAYNLAAAAEYQLASQWVLGGSLALDNVSDYRQWGGRLYLRYLLEPSGGPLALPPLQHRSPYEAR